MESFDIDKAIKYIRERISESVRLAITDDDLEVIVEMIFDYYEDNGLLDLDSDMEDPTPAVVAEYISNKILLSEPDYQFISFVPEIVEAEFGYEQMLFNEVYE